MHQYNPGELSHTPITDSCCRTARYHIGTVAVASLIIAVIQFIRAVITYIEAKASHAAGGKPNIIQRAVFCIIQCCLSCIQCCMDKINKNALVWTAIWGDSFGTAACSSFKLLWANMGRTGAMSIVATFMMFLGKVTIALATMGSGAIFIHFVYPNISSPVLPMVAIFVVGYVVGSLFMAVFEVAMDSVFLCFLIDEKLHAASGTMCASKGLVELVDSDEMTKHNTEHNKEQNLIQEQRCERLGLDASEHHSGAGTSATGVVMAAPASLTGAAPTSLYATAPAPTHGGDDSTSIYFTQSGLSSVVYGNEGRTLDRIEPWLTNDEQRVNDNMMMVEDDNNDGTIVNGTLTYSPSSSSRSSPSVPLRRAYGVDVRSKIEPGKFILFPATLPHYVLPHQFDPTVAMEATAASATTVTKVEARTKHSTDVNGDDDDIDDDPSNTSPSTARIIIAFNIMIDANDDHDRDDARATNNGDKGGVFKIKIKREHSQQWKA